MRWWWCKKHDSLWQWVEQRVRNENFNTFRTYIYIFYFVIFSFCLVFFATFFSISHRKIVSTLFQLVVVNACTSLKFYYFCWSFSLLSFLRVERNFLPANFVTTTTKADSSVIYLCLYMPLTMEIYIYEWENVSKKINEKERTCV